MDHFEELPWSWHTLRSTAEQLSFFDMDFEENPNDVFYCLLNEIEPKLIGLVKKDEGYNAEENPIDPRTQKPVKELIVYHDGSQNSAENSNIFRNFLHKSALSKNVQAITLRAMTAVRNDETLNASDRHIYESTKDKRKTENEQFQEFVKNYETAKLSETSDWENLLMNCFQKKLQLEMEKIGRETVRYYTLTTMVPLELENIENPAAITVGPTKLVYKEGIVPILETELAASFLSRLDRDFTISNEDQSWHNKILEKERTLGNEEYIDIVISEEAISVLFESMLNNSDTFEICLSIHSDKVIFEDPLPMRIFNSFEKMSAIDVIIQNELSRNRSSKFIAIESNKFLSEPNDPELLEKNDVMEAVDVTVDYKLQKIEYFLTEMLNERITQRKTAKNILYTKWCVAHGTVLNILTKTKYQFCTSKSNSVQYLDLCLKLENKLEFGAEIMTKRELLREWMKIYLKQETSNIQRFRMNAKNGEIVQEETLSLTDVEADLQRLYNIKPFQFISPLSKLFAQLKTFPDGNYLLQKTSKHSGKLLVYQESPEKQPTSVDIKTLYTAPQIQDTFRKPEYIPVDSQVILPMHTTYGIVPCCFPHWGSVKNVTVNDRPQIIRKAMLKTTEKEATITSQIIEKRKQRKRIIKKRKTLQRQKEQRINETADIAMIPLNRLEQQMKHSDLGAMTRTSLTQEKFEESPSVKTYSLRPNRRRVFNRNFKQNVVATIRKINKKS